MHHMCRIHCVYDVRCTMYVPKSNLFKVLIWILVYELTHAAKFIIIIEKNGIETCDVRAL